MNPMGTVYRAPVIQSPVTEKTTQPQILAPFVMPEVEEGEALKPRILAIKHRIKGKRNPIHGLRVGGQDFVQFRMPADWTVPEANPHTMRPNLPVMNLTDRQVEALWERARQIEITDTFRPPESDDDALRGRHTFKASELIIIADYEQHGDPFAIAHEAMMEAERAIAAQDTEPDVYGADEVQKSENALRQSNDKPQRGEDRADSNRKAKSK